MDAVGEGIVLFGADYVRPYWEKYDNLVGRGMKKVKCALLPPELAKIYDENVAIKANQSR